MLFHPKSITWNVLSRYITEKAQTIANEIQNYKINMLRNYLLTSLSAKPQQMKKNDWVFSKTWPWRKQSENTILQEILVKHGQSKMNKNGDKIENTRNVSLALHGQRVKLIGKSQKYWAKQKHSKKQQIAWRHKKSLWNQAVILKTEALRQNNFTRDRDPYINTWLLPKISK